MNYISTRNNQKNFTFKDVFLKGLADDGGLFVLRFKSFNKFAVLPIRSTCGALTLNHSGFEIKLLGLLVTLNLLDL